MIQKNQLKVLLVEDNPDHAVLVKNAITKGKDGRYQVQLCASVEDAIEIMKSDHFNMVISDFNLAGKNGLQLLSWLNDQRIELPFIMVTGAGDEKIAVQAMQDGAYNYVVKDDVYLSVLPHVVDETFIKFLANQAQEQYEQEIRKKNIELEQANRNLKKLDQLKSDFVASVSHDVRSPLNSIQESIALILDGIVDVREEKGRRVLEISKRSTERLGKMIDDLLDFSKIEGGKMYLHIEPANIQVLIDEALGSLKSLADRKKVTYDFKPNDSFPTVPCDPERMIQVFTNLIGNAIKFTPAGGTVSVKTELTDDRVQIVVEDTGIGIKKEDLPKIFGRFEQVRGADSGGIKGTGLGLAICKELVAMHQGDIRAESKSGKGSCFIISLLRNQESRTVNLPLRGGAEEKAS